MSFCSEMRTIIEQLLAAPRGGSGVAAVRAVVLPREIDDVRRFFPSPEKIWFCTDKIEPIEHDSISVIVSRFTALTKNFVIWCYQVAEFFCPRYCFASASSAGSPRNLGSQAYFAICEKCCDGLMFKCGCMCLFSSGLEPCKMGQCCAC